MDTKKRGRYNDPYFQRTREDEEKMFPFRKKDFEGFEDDPNIPAVTQVKWAKASKWKWGGLAITIFSMIGISLYMEFYVWSLILLIGGVASFLWTYRFQLGSQKLQLVMNIEGIYSQLYEKSGLILWSNVYTTRLTSHLNDNDQTIYHFDLEFNLKYLREHGIKELSIPADKFNISAEQLNYTAKAHRYRHHISKNEL